MSVQFDKIGDLKPKVTAGGKDKTKFVPNLNVSFFDDEFYFNLNRKDKIIKNEKAATASGKTSLGGIDTDIWYIDDKGRFKWDIEFTSRPAANSWTWELKHTKGIEFYYQGALTAEEIADGCVRPDEVVGSYAVYCNKVNNKYKTGKLCHIYRPFCYDAKGNTIYADLKIADGQLTITIDAGWLDNAAYPVRLDPTIGYTTAGGGWFALPDRAAFYKISAAISGTANPGQIYVHVLTAATQYMRCGLYSSNDGGINGATKLSSAEEEIVLPTGELRSWYNGDITISGGISSSTDYIIAVHGDDCYIAYDDGGTGWYDALTYTPGENSLPSTGPNADSRAYSFSTYLDYTESGGTGNSYYYQQQQM